MNWYSDNIATLGDRLNAGREDAGLSQKQLAEMIGVKTSVIKGWENDTNEPRANRLQMLAGVLGVSVGWLITGEGDGPADPDDRSADTANLGTIVAELRALNGTVSAALGQISSLEARLEAFLAAEKTDD